MKAFAFASPSHLELADLWLESAKNDPDLEPHLIQLPCAGGNGDYQNPQWRDVNKVVIARLIELFLVEQPPFLVTGSDIVFLRPCVPWLLSNATSRLLWFHDENGTGLQNPDVMFVLDTDFACKLWSRFQKQIDAWDGQLSSQMAMIDSPQIGTLPNFVVANPVNKGINPMIFHANNTPPPNSVAKKLALMLSALKTI